MRRKTQREFEDELYEINPNITIIGKYINSQTKIEYRCNIDGYVGKAVPNSLLRGYGCPKCGGNYRMTTDDFIKRVKGLNENVDVLSEYVNYRTPVKCRCKIDDYEWDAMPQVLLRRGGCPKCTNHAPITTEIFIERMKTLNPDIEVLGEYVHCEEGIKCRCKICDHIWHPTPSNLKHGTGCPICNLSKGEKRVKKHLESLGIQFEIYQTYEGLVGYCGKSLSYDFYLPEYNTLIEYQGNFHDGSITGSYHESFDFDRQKEYDRRKREYAHNHEISLLEIWYWDYENIETILDSYLSTAEKIYKGNKA